MNTLRMLSLAAVAAFTFAAAPSFAQDAMAPAPMAPDAMAPMAPDAMAPDAMAPDAMAPMMSDADLKTCLEQAKAITFAPVMQAATDACHSMHNGPMAGDAMAPAADAMAPDTMAPAPDAMAPATK